MARPSFGGSTRPQVSTGDVVPDRNGDVDNVERLEAEARVCMWEMSRIEPRGFDSIKRREALHREFDALVDRWAESRLLQALERISKEPA